MTNYLTIIQPAPVVNNRVVIGGVVQGNARESADQVTITIGTTTLAAAGQLPAVTNSGTSTDAILDFVIPAGTGIAIVELNESFQLVITLTDGQVLITESTRGAQGIQGETGLKGDTGNTGPQGEQGVPGTDGTNGIDGTNGTDGINGTNGLNGKNAYQSYLDTTTDDPVMTETEWAAAVAAADEAFTEVDYRPVLTITHDPAQPNSFVTVTDDIQVSIASNGKGSGSVDFILTSGEEVIDLNVPPENKIGAHNYPSTAGAVVHLRYQETTAGTVWFYVDDSGFYRDGVASVDEIKVVNKEDTEQFARLLIGPDYSQLAVDAVLFEVPAGYRLVVGSTENPGGYVDLINMEGLRNVDEAQIGGVIYGNYFAGTPCQYRQGDNLVSNLQKAAAKHRFLVANTVAVEVSQTALESSVPIKENDVDVAKIITLTQAAYDALATKHPTTIYAITD